MLSDAGSGVSVSVLYLQKEMIHNEITISLIKLVQFSGGCNLMLVKQRLYLVPYMKTPVLQFV